MNSIIKYSIIAAISAASLPAGAKVYECNVGGVTVYTSRPSANCHTPDLPRIGSYTSIAPRVAPPPREPAAQASAAPASPRRASMSTNRAANAPIRTAPPLQTAFGQQRPPHHFGTRTGQRTAGFGIRAKRTECRPRAEKPKPRQPAHGQHPRPPSKYPGPSARIEPDVGCPNAENPETRCRFQDFCFYTAFSDGLLRGSGRLKALMPIQIPVSYVLVR